jgi:hypothetical protein
MGAMGCNNSRVNGGAGRSRDMTRSGRFRIRHRNFTGAWRDLLFDLAAKLPLPNSTSERHKSMTCRQRRNISASLAYIG